MPDITVTVTNSGGNVTVSGATGGTPTIYSGATIEVGVAQSGSSFTSDASSLTTGTLSAARLPASVVQSVDGEVTLNTTVPTGEDVNDYTTLRLTRNGTTVAAIYATGTLFLTGDIVAQNISGTTISAVTLGGQLNGNQIVSGIVSAQRLGTGSPSTGTWLRGDGAWSGITHRDVDNVMTSINLSASQDNLSLGSGGVVRLIASAAAMITGISYSVGGDARLLSNVSSFPVTLKHSSASSIATNRILCVGNVDYVIPAGGSAAVYYDNSSGRWRVG